MNAVETDAPTFKMKLRPLDLIVQPQVRGILSDIKKCASFAIIAGGYLRDKYYGVTFKDIDIFTSADLDVSKLKAVFSDWSVHATEDDLELDADTGQYVKDGNQFGIHNLSHPAHATVQVMTSDAYMTVMSVLSKFDFGFCQIAFDGSLVMVTDAFWQDATNNTATFLKEKKLPQYSQHEQRLRKKYPNLTWVDSSASSSDL